MKKLSEKEIIELMNKKKIRSEDVEIFKLGNEQCAVCVDTLVESTDIPKCSKLSDISRKSVVSSLSDFASKGIIPKFCIISLTLPKTISKKQVQELSKGFSKVCKEFKIQLLGGDTNQGNEISIHVVLFGNVKNFIRRNDAKVKDVICTTGPFGYTASALEIIMKKRKSVQSFSTKSKNLFFKFLGVTVKTNSNSSPPSKTNLFKLISFFSANSTTSSFVGIFVIRNFFLL